MLCATGRGATPPKEDPMQVSASLLVTKAIAEGLPSRPDWTKQCMDQAADAMSELAAERHRHITGPPRLADARDTRLGYVELTFFAETAAD